MNCFDEAKCVVHARFAYADAWASAKEFVHSTRSLEAFGAVALALEQYTGLN